jgi:hypothetical protein
MLRRKSDRAPRPDRSEEFASYVAPRTSVRMATPHDLSARVVDHSLDVMRPACEPKRATRREEAAYMGRVAALGCIVCRIIGLGATPAQVHHVRAGQGAAQRAGNFCVVPLCEPHHTGPKGVHGDKSCLRAIKLSEMDLLDQTIGELI